MMKKTANSLKKSIKPGPLQFLRTLFIISIGFILIQCQKQESAINLHSLLLDMPARVATPEFPTPFFTLKQYSSYDQNTKAPNQEGWFANHDASWFIGEEANDGRREFIMLDADGPGAIVRFWMTFGNKDAYTGTIRFYFDGSTSPEIEGPVLDIISGGKLVGDPLSSSVSNETNYYQRGHNLYLPIPYSKHLKITYECPALDPVKHSPSVYYNIDYRTYEAGTEVSSFTMEQLAAEQSTLALVLSTLKEIADPVEEMATISETNKSQLLPSDESLEVDLDKGKQAIYKIQLKLKAVDRPQALRSTVISMIFDDEPTVWAPVGDFFGTGYQIRPHQTWYSKVSDEGLMEAYWIMPFKKSAKITLTNHGSKAVQIMDFTITSGAYKWTKNTMHFGAVWHELHQVETGGSKNVNGDDGHFDVNFVELSGQGIYIADVLTVFNTADAWWGEGDEKIYVDGENFPSHIGTGSEDYFGYAWCRPEKFSHFLIAQPDGSGNFHSGMSINMRHRILDVIPFQSSIKFDMELWHWAKTVINYAPMSYWYLKPGGSVNIKPDIELVKNIVALAKNDILEPVPVKDGLLEGENLRILSLSEGNTQIQTSTQWGWSNNAQLWWMDGGKNGKLEADFIMEKGGKFQVELQFTRAIDYANFRIGINGVFNNQTFVGYHDQTGGDVITKKVSLGTMSFKEGINTLSVEIRGKHPSAVDRWMVGIDCLRIAIN